MTDLANARVQAAARQNVNLSSFGIYWTLHALQLSRRVHGCTWSAADGDHVFVYAAQACEPRRHSAHDFLDYLGVFDRRRCRKRTPGPPPFSSMNSTPAPSRARLITSRVALRGSLAPASTWRTVTMPTPARSARSC